MRTQCSATSITGDTSSKSLVSSSFSELEYVVPPIQINWRSADLTAMPSHPSASGGASGNGVPLVNSPQASSLSPGAIGGIAAGGFVILCVLIVLFIQAMRRRSKRQAAGGVFVFGVSGCLLLAVFL